LLKFYPDECRNEYYGTEQEIVGEFALFDSWDDKYEYIIDLGKTAPLDQK
jgi:sulfur transfer protein SufE